MDNTADSGGSAARTDESRNMPRRCLFLDAVAHHEAGHAVAAIVSHVAIEYVTIEADGEARGRVRCRKLPRTFEQRHTRGMIAVAGLAAQRRFNPRSLRWQHGAGDRNEVAVHAMQVAGSAAQVRAVTTLWEIQARDFVEHRWPDIQRVAAALLERKTLTGGEV